MKSLNTQTYNRQDASMIKVTLGFLVSPLIVLVSMASVISI